MATYTVDLRGLIHDTTPEDVLDDVWRDEIPHADRFGVQSVLEYRFMDSPGNTQAVVDGDRIEGIFNVPRKELWEVFAVEQQLIAETAAGVYNQIGLNVWPHYAEFSAQAGADFWKDKAPRVDAYPVTQLAHFEGTSDWSTRDEASEAIPEAGLRKRIFYPGQRLIARMDMGAAVTVNRWLARVTCVRYPSTARLFAMLEGREISERELFAALALRFPSPPEAS